MFPLKCKPIWFKCNMEMAGNYDVEFYIYIFFSSKLRTSLSGLWQVIFYVHFLLRQWNNPPFQKVMPVANKVVSLWFIYILQHHSQKKIIFFNEWHVFESFNNRDHLAPPLMLTLWSEFCSRRLQSLLTLWSEFCSRRYYSHFSLLDSSRGS